MKKFKLTSIGFAIAMLSAANFAYAANELPDWTLRWGTVSSGGAFAVGSGSKATNSHGVAIGDGASASSFGSTALGFNSNSLGTNSVAIGSVAVAQYQAVAIGIESKAIGSNSIAIGANAIVGVYSPAVGSPGDDNYQPDQSVAASQSIALGDGIRVTANRAVAIGAGSSATVERGIALGVDSLADRFGTVELAYLGEDQSGQAWKSSVGAASIGKEGLNRQLIHVAAGSADTDAVNVAQLKALRKITEENTIIGTGASNLISEAVPDDPDTSDVNEAKDAVYAQNAVALGNNAKVQADGAVAIGANSIAQSRFIETTDETTGITTRTAPTGYLMPKTGDVNTAVWQGDVSQGVVSFGGSYQREVKDANGVLPGEDGYISTTETVNFNRQITGVAAGSEDNDAVNVAQLKQLESNTKTELNSLMTGDTQVSKIQLTSDPTDETAPTIGLRYEVAKAEPVALADGDPVTPTTSQGRLVYDSLDTNGNVIGTETIATLNDGFFVKGGNTAADAAGVKVDLNKGISFLGDEYLQTSVTEGADGGAVVTVGASQALKDFLNQSGVQPSDPTPGNPDNSGNSGNTGGSTWTPNAAQQAALNGTYANGLTVGEGNNAVSIAREKDADGRYIVDMGGNRVQNVGNPIAAGDAANKQYVDSTARSLRNKINDVDKDLRAGVAMAMAVGNLPQAYMPGKSIVGMSAGTYHGQGGFALGLSHATDNRQWVFKGAASVDTRGNFGGTLSAGYQF